METLHLFVDGALDMVHVNVPVIHSVTERCEEFIVNVTTLQTIPARGASLLWMLFKRALTPGSVVSVQSVVALSVWPQIALYTD